MDQYLTLNDGTVLDNSYAIENGGVLWLYVYAPLTMAQVFGMLNDPEKTAQIAAYRFGLTTEHEGFRELFCIQKENGGFISAGLRK